MNDLNVLQTLAILSINLVSPSTLRGKAMRVGGGPRSNPPPKACIHECVFACIRDGHVNHAKFSLRLRFRVGLYSSPYIARAFFWGCAQITRKDYLQREVFWELHRLSCSICSGLSSVYTFTFLGVPFSLVFFFLLFFPVPLADARAVGHVPRQRRKLFLPEFLAPINSHRWFHQELQLSGHLRARQRAESSAAPVSETAVNRLYYIS